MLLFQELVFSLPLPFWWSSSHQPATGIRFSKMNASPTKDIILMINDWHSSTRLPAMPKIYKFILFSTISVILFFCMLEESLPPFHSYFLIACIPGTSTTPSVNWYSHYPVICCHTTHTKQIVRPAMPHKLCQPPFIFFSSFDDHFHNSGFHVCSYRTLALLSYPTNKH